MFSKVFFFSENRAVYEKMWENIVERGRPQTTIWITRIAFWISKATDTHSEYITLTALPQQQWLHERGSMLRHTYFACLVMVVLKLSAACIVTV